MSVELNFYVGPYLECKYHLIDATESRWSCPNSVCSQSGKHAQKVAKFCPVCGTQLGNILVAIKEHSTNRWDFIEAIGETLSQVDPEGYMANGPTNCDLFIPNSSQDFCVYKSSSDGDEFLSLGWGNISALSQAFASKFDIAIIEANKRYDEVKVCFGAMVWRD